MISLCFKLYKEALDLAAEETSRRSGVEGPDLAHVVGKLLLMLGKKLPSTMAKHTKAKALIEQYKEKGEYFLRS